MADEETLCQEADRLLGEGKGADALGLALKIVNLSPASARARLLLSRVYAYMGLFTIAAKEVEEVYISEPNNWAVEKLLSKLSPGALAAAKGRLAAGNAPQEVKKAKPEGVIAEADFDLGDIE